MNINSIPAYTLQNTYAKQKTNATVQPSFGKDGKPSSVQRALAGFSAAACLAAPIVSAQHAKQKADLKEQKAYVETIKNPNYTSLSQFVNSVYSHADGSAVTGAERQKIEKIILDDLYKKSDGAELTGAEADLIANNSVIVPNK